ncbi:hypothetical protein BD410DRAFT_786349 [Rickenella mellea]|uniref:Ubiquitin-like domain-containing protein n=1 Tax=Rickenella mellea TaxID=50990 RepID=A0A4Y7QBP0_9AGAM|nr:hypothetical protein BD410DRAFT_786349 [Rickenella mellea]
MFPVTFGSFGDIVTAAQLASQIVKALSDSCGSSVQYQELIEEVRSLSATLQMAYSAAMNCTSYPRAEDMRTVVDEITLCKFVLARFLNRIHGYQKSLGKGGTGNSWRKIGWSLFKTQEVVEMKAKIAGYKETITLFMVSLTSHSMTRFEDETRRELTRINVSLTCIMEGRFQMPKSVGWTALNGVRIIDALGRDIIVPPELVPTWPDMEYFLKLRFKSCAGSRLVESGYYSLFHQPLTLPINWVPISDVWETLVESGKELVMAIRVNRPFYRTCVVCNVYTRGLNSSSGFCTANLTINAPPTDSPLEKLEESGWKGEVCDDDDGIRYLRHIVIE